MTSNVGASELNRTQKLGFGSEDDYDDVRDRQINALKQVMKPEFINRIDEIVVFTPLEKPDVEKIADIMLKNLENVWKTTVLRWKFRTRRKHTLWTKDTTRNTAQDR